MPPKCHQAVLQSGAGWSRVEAQEGDDSGVVVDPGLGVAVLPVEDGELVHVESLSELGLSEAQLEAFRLKMLSECLCLPRGIQWFRALTDLTPEWQEGNAAMSNRAVEGLERRRYEGSSSVGSFW